MGEQFEMILLTLGAKPRRYLERPFRALDAGKISQALKGRIVEKGFSPFHGRAIRNDFTDAEL